MMGEVMNDSKRSMPHDFIIDLKKFTSVTAVTVQALRRQGPGTIEHIQEYLNGLDLFQTKSIQSQDEFIYWLDKQTQALMTKCKIRWGAARKALNLFLRACLYDKYLSTNFGLDRLETWLEIPLDQVIAGELRRDMKKIDGRCSLPSWCGVSNLKEEKSKQFQDYARKMAARNGLAPVHLDVNLWVNNRKNRLTR